jgi:hypothetical protein
VAFTIWIDVPDDMKVARNIVFVMMQLIDSSTKLHSLFTELYQMLTEINFDDYENTTPTDISVDKLTLFYSSFQNLFEEEESYK